MNDSIASPRPPPLHNSLGCTKGERTRLVPRRFVSNIFSLYSAGPKPEKNDSRNPRLQKSRAECLLGGSARQQRTPAVARAPFNYLLYLGQFINLAIMKPGLCTSFTDRIDSCVLKRFSLADRAARSFRLNSARSFGFYRS